MLGHDGRWSYIDINVCIWQGVIISTFGIELATYIAILIDLIQVVIKMATRKCMLGHDDRRTYIDVCIWQGVATRVADQPSAWNGKLSTGDNARRCTDLNNLLGHMGRNHIWLIIRFTYHAGWITRHGHYGQPSRALLITCLESARKCADLSDPGNHKWLILRWLMYHKSRIHLATMANKIGG